MKLDRKAIATDEYKHQADAFRSWVTADNASPFPLAQNRYHFYISLRFALSEWLHLGVQDRDIQSSPRRKLGRLPACYFVCERNSVGRIRT
jgi:hypothetical protein